MTWAYLIVAVVVLILGIALAPKPQGPKAAEIDDFDFPTAEEGRPIPVVFGETDIRGSNVLWYGDLNVKAIRKRSGFSKTTVGYKYFLGVHMGLCHGPVDQVNRILIGEKQAWAGAVTTNGDIVINNEELFGGQKREGGFSGTINVCMGADDQTANAYLSSKLASVFPGVPIPAFRGVLGLVVNQSYIGTSAYPKVWATRVRRIAKGWYQDNIFYPTKLTITEEISGVGTVYTMNPAHIIYQCLTDPRWGMGVSTDLIDEVSFQAVADKLFDEGFGMSVLWNQSTSIEQFLQIVLDHIAGGLTLNNSTGKYEMILVRGDYDIDDLETYDENDISQLIDYQRQGWGETVNEIILKYTDPKTGKDTTISQQDLANIEAQQSRVPQIIELKGIKSHRVAQTVVARELVSRVTPISKVVFEINRRAWSVRYGNLFKLNWAPRGIQGTVYRVLKVSKGTLVKGGIRIEALEDIYALGVNGSIGIPGEPPDDEASPTTPADPVDTGANVISTSTTTPPGSPADGDSYLIPGDGTGTGAWAGHEGQVADWDEENNTWIYTDVPDNTLVYDETTGTWHSVVGGVAGDPPWTPAIPSLTDLPSPDLPTLDLVVWDTVAEEYRRIAADEVGGGDSSTDVADVVQYSYAGGMWLGEADSAPCYSVDGDIWFLDVDRDQTPKNVLVGSDSKFRGARGNQLGISADKRWNSTWSYVSKTSFPTAGISGGPTWEQIIEVSGTYYTWTRNIAAQYPYAIIISSTDFSTWTEVGASDMPQEFELVDLIRTTEWLAFGHLREEVSPGVYEYRPRVYSSSNLTSWTLRDDLSPNPTTDNWQVLSVVRNGVTIVVGLVDNNSTAVGKLFLSTDTGATFAASTISLPTGPGVIGLTYDGANYVASGRDWTAKSANAASSSWTVHSSIFGLSENFKVISDGAGTTVAGLSTATTFGTAYSTDSGVTWTRSIIAPETNRASAVSYENWDEDFTARTVEDAIDELRNDIGSITNYVYRDGTVPTGNTIGNSAVETAFGSSYTLSPEQLVIGSVISFRAAGVYSTHSTPPTLRLRIKFDGTTILDTTAFTTTASLTNLGWVIEGQAIITTAGTSGQIECQGRGVFSTGVTTAALLAMANTAKISANIDSSVTVTISAQWGTANAASTLTMRQMTIQQQVIGTPPSTVHWDSGTQAGNIVLTNALRTSQRTTSGGWNSVRANKGVSSGKWYWEIHADSGSSMNSMIFGVGRNTLSQTSYVGSDANSYGWQGSNAGPLKWNNASSTSYGTNPGIGGVLMFALDMDNGKLWFGQNGTWMTSGNPAAGTNASFSGLSGTMYPAVGYAASAHVSTARFNSSEWTYSAPAGFVALPAP